MKQPAYNQCIKDVCDAAEAAEEERLPRKEMAQLQRALKKMGFDIGPADGVSGRKTGQAIAKFLTDRGLDPYETPVREAQRLILEAAGMR